MMGSEGNIVTEIKKVIYDFLPESEVIMFGSRARGDNQINSDYDFLVVSKDVTGIKRKTTGVGGLH